MIYVAENKTREETKQQFTLEGAIVGLHSEKAYKEGEFPSGALWKQIRFGIKTKEDNIVYVKLRGGEYDEVGAYSQKDKAYKKFKWEERDNLPESYHVIDTDLYLDTDENGKLIREQVVAFDAIEKILLNLSDGDFVRVRGEKYVNSFEGRDGKTVTLTDLNLKSLSRLDRTIDFKTDDFEEVNEFIDQIVVKEVFADAKTRKVTVKGYYISRKEDFAEVEYVVDTNLGDKFKKLANGIGTLKFGALLTVKGRLVNRPIVHDVDSGELGMDELASLFGEDCVEEVKTVKGYDEYNEIHAVTGLICDKYTEDDFKEEEEELDSNFVDEDTEDFFEDTDDEFDIFNQ